MNNIEQGNEGKGGGADVKKIVAALKRGAEAAGLKGFIAGFEADGVATTHIEQSSMQLVSRLTIAFFNQLCDFEEGNGAMSKEYRVAIGEMKRDFNNLVRAYNARFDAIRKSAGRPGTKTS